jgi:hypothetical protein
MPIPALSDIVRGGVSAFDAGSGGGGGGGTISRHEIDFGAAPVSAVTVDLTIAGVTSGQRVVAALSLDMPAGVELDELEMDPIVLAAHAIATDTVRVLAVSHAPVSGKRAINLMR